MRICMFPSVYVGKLHANSLYAKSASQIPNIVK